METAVRFAMEEHAKGNGVLVHCTFGVGRSAAVLSACMRASGMFRSMKDAFDAVKGKHPIVKDTIEIKDSSSGNEFGAEPLLVDFEDEDVDVLI